LSKPMVEEIEQENFVCDNIDRIGTEIKKSKDNERLASRLEVFAEQWAVRTKKEGSARLPFNISYCTRELEIKVILQKIVNGKQPALGNPTRIRFVK